MKLLIRLVAIRVANQVIYAQLADVNHISCVCFRSKITRQLHRQLYLKLLEYSLMQRPSTCAKSVKTTLILELYPQKVVSYFNIFRIMLHVFNVCYHQSQTSLIHRSNDDGESI